jgi:hypothetical protein
LKIGVQPIAFSALNEGYSKLTGDQLKEINALEKEN